MSHDLIIVPNKAAPGDLVACTALIRDLYEQYPGIRLSVRSKGGHRELFRDDYRISHPTLSSKPVVIDFAPSINCAAVDRTKRYVYCPHESFEAQTGIQVVRGDPRPSLVCSAERPWKLPANYGLVFSGYKVDMPVKAWPTERFQEVVDRTSDIVSWCQAGEIHDGWYPQNQDLIARTTNLLGESDLYETMRLIKYASVVLCHTSMPMLMAAAFGTPCVVIGGGREHPWLFDGLGVDYLHTVGDIECCADRGCMKSIAKVGTPGNGHYCDRPVWTSLRVVGECMERIAVDRVISSIRAAVA